MFPSSYVATSFSALTLHHTAFKMIITIFLYPTEAMEMKRENQFDKLLSPYTRVTRAN